jgi:hypothetical protein
MVGVAELVAAAGISKQQCTQPSLSLEVPETQNTHVHMHMRTCTLTHRGTSRSTGS